MVVLPHIRCGICVHVIGGMWHIDDVSAPGTNVLLARRAVRNEWPQQQLDHPCVLKTYGERGGDGGTNTEDHNNTLVCEEGWLLDEFLTRDVGIAFTARVLRDVLSGLWSMHEQGYAHGQVNAEHIVVGVDNKGNLLVPFCRGVPYPASDLEDKAPAPVDRQIAQDLVAFAKCAMGRLEHLRDINNQTQVYKQLERTVQQLRMIIDRSDELGARKTRPILVRAISRLADFEAEHHQARVLSSQ